MATGCCCSSSFHVHHYVEFHHYHHQPLSWACGMATCYVSNGWMDTNAQVRFFKATSSGGRLSFLAGHTNHDHIKNNNSTTKASSDFKTRRIIPSTPEPRPKIKPDGRRDGWTTKPQQLKKNRNTRKQRYLRLKGGDNGQNGQQNHSKTNKLNLKKRRF